MCQVLYCATVRASVSPDLADVVADLGKAAADAGAEIAADADELVGSLCVVGWKDTVAGVEKTNNGVSNDVDQKWS